MAIDLEHISPEQTKAVSFRLPIDLVSELKAATWRRKESQTEIAIQALRRELAVTAAEESDDAAWPPAWFGAIETDHDDISENVDEFLADGFGQ